MLRYESLIEWRDFIKSYDGYHGLVSNLKGNLQWLVLQLISEGRVITHSTGPFKFMNVFI